MIGNRNNASGLGSHMGMDHFASFDRNFAETAGAVKSAARTAALLGLLKILALVFVAWLIYQAYMHSALVHVS
jgi:hypothetical protein